MDAARNPLDEADACHDDDPARAAALLMALDPAAVPAGDRGRLAFLLNHVVGERIGDWRGAHARQAALLEAAGADAPAVLWRQAAAAARLAGDAPGAAAAAEGLARTAGGSAAQAAHVVALTAASYRVPSLDAAQAGAATLDAMAPLQQESAWQQAGPLDAAAAACCNNLSAHLSERPVGELAIAPLRAAMAVSGELAQTLWRRAGTWVHQERACYQRAIVSNTLGEPHRAQAHADEGLALLDANDTADEEFIDRAFLELELSHALERLGLGAEATDALERAKALAGRFDDDGLAAWFASRRARLEALRRA